MDPAPFDLNLRHLRAVAAVATRGGLSAATRAVGLSQPALTQGLRKLERQLGLQLFDRRPYGMIPTAAGRILADRCTTAFGHLDAAMQLPRADVAGVFNMGGAAVANFVSILERRG